MRPAFLLAPLMLAACQSPTGGATSDPAALADQTKIAIAVLTDYDARYTPGACLAPVTIGRDGPEAIPHDLDRSAITWTYLERSKQGLYESLDPVTASAITDVWGSLRTGKYPSVTLPADALPKPASGCAGTLTLTSPMIGGVNAFVRWSDGSQRRTMALRKNSDGWAVVAEGPARIG